MNSATRENAAQHLAVLKTFARRINHTLYMYTNKIEELWEQLGDGLPNYSKKFDPTCKRESRPLEEKYNQGRREIILIRHGQYNLDGRSDEEMKLTPLGREQAAYTGRRLFRLLYAQGIYPMSKVENTVKYVQSPLTRARETAAIILETMEDCIKQEKLPHHRPIAHTQTINDIAEGFPIEPDPPLSEDPREIPELEFRIEEQFRKIFKIPQGSNTAVCATEIYVCHGNVIRFFMLRALQLDPRAWLRLSLAHCGIVWITIDKTGMVNVRTFGDSGHIPASKLSY